MLQAIFDPFHRPPGDPRRYGDQHDIGKYRLLDAEAAAGVPRRPQPKSVARDLQRPRHDRMQAERSLEIGQHVVGALCGIVFGDDAIGFDRRAGIARIADIDADAVRGGGKGALGIAVTKDALADDITVRFRMERGSIRRCRRERIDHRRQWSIADFDEIERVLGAIAVGRDHDGDRLADITHAIGRYRPTFDAGLYAHHQA